MLFHTSFVCCCQFKTTFSAAACQQFAAIFGGHTRTKSVLVGSFSTRWLISSFHRLDVFYGTFLKSRAKVVFRFEITKGIALIFWFFCNYVASPEGQKIENRIFTQCGSRFENHTGAYLGASLRYVRFLPTLFCQRCYALLRIANAERRSRPTSLVQRP